jgi:hypothetical protein
MTVQHNSNGSGVWHRCPRCLWAPDGCAEWYCDKCGCRWNTFETHGRCPKCSFEWTETQCGDCGEWSAHESWYVKATSVH